MQFKVHLNLAQIGDLKPYTLSNTFLNLHKMYKDSVWKTVVIWIWPVWERQSLSLTLMRGNAALIVGRKPEDDFVGAEVDGVL